MRKEVVKWLSSKVEVNEYKLYGTDRYLQVCVASGIEILLTDIIQLKEKIEAEDVQISSVHTEDLGYCLMFEFFK